MTSVDGGLRARPLRWVVLGLCLMLALLLGVISLQRNLQRACELHEWPDFSSCPVPDEAVPAQVRDLRARIAAHGNHDRCRPQPDGGACGHWRN